jgi:hypothetical protein
LGGDGDDIEGFIRLDGRRLFVFRLTILNNLPHKFSFLANVDFFLCRFNVVSRNRFSLFAFVRFGRGSGRCETRFLRNNDVYRGFPFDGDGFP